MSQQSQKKSIHFITGSANKFKEAKEIFQNDGYELIQYKFDLPEYQGNPKEIAIRKCLQVESEIPDVPYPFFIEDTGLCYNCLNGLPGPYIKWFLMGIGLDGLVKLAEPHLDKTAYAMCIITMKMNKQSEPISFISKIDGRITSPRGPTNFGWDPIFEVDGFTFAEMEKSHKNKLSHRFLALKNLSEYLDTI